MHTITTLSEGDKVMMVVGSQRLHRSAVHEPLRAPRADNCDSGRQEGGIMI